MADVLRIKRRTSGQPDAPGSLANAELAYNEVSHILYYGEGGTSTGGANVVPIAGKGMSSDANPVMNGTAAPGTATVWSRGDHVHPSDTSKASSANPTFTGLVTISGTIGGPGMNTWAASPPSIGSLAPGNGSFAILTAQTVTATGGFVGLMASPGPIGSTKADTGSFTNLVVSGSITGSGSTGLLAGYAKVDSQIFTGTPQLPIGATGVTQPLGTNNTTLATTAFARSLRLNELAPPVAAVSMNSQQLTNVLDPVGNQDAATKKYVDNNSAGLSAKGAVAAATAGVNITLSGLLTIDGYTVAVNDRVLVKDQTLPQNNGIYIAASGAWTRATDMDAWAEVPQAYVFVSNGTVNSASSWVCNAVVGGTLGTTPITWVQFSQQAQVTAGAGLVRTGNSFDIGNTPGRISVLADSIDIDTAWIGQPSITTLGAITTGTWNATVISIAKGGTGATSLPAGFLQSNGSVVSTVAQVPVSGIAGLGDMSAQYKNAVQITGGTIDGITFDMGTF